MNLYPYQERGVQHLLTHTRAGLWSECGLGKTAMMLTAIRELPKPVIVIAPKRVILHTWPEEISKWTPELTFISLTGTPAQRSESVKKQVDIYLINFELVVWLIENNRWVWPTVVIDESSRIKNRATKVFKALRKVAGKWKHHYQMTGTPAPNGLIDLWSQLYLLDRGERLGRTLTAFRERWFKADYMGWGYEAHPHAQKEIQERCRDICESMLESDYLNLPDMMTIDVPVDMPPAGVKAYKELKNLLLTEVDGKDIVAITAAALVNKLLQVTSGAAYTDEGETKHIHDAKLDALDDLVDGEPLIIAYHFRHELARLRKCYPWAVEVRDGDDTVSRWNKGEIETLLLHPASAGHGLNLQHGGHRIVWFTPTWNLEHYVQTNARLHRTGQTKPVIVYRLVVEGAIDVRVCRALTTKSAVQDILMDSLKQSENI